MARKAPPKKRNSDMDMRAPARLETTVVEESQIPAYDISDATPLMDESRHTKSPSYAPFIIFCVLLLGALGVAGYFYQEWNSLRQNPQEVQEDKTKEVVAQVRKLIDVPRGETPVLATVSNTESLQGQEFFENAKEGDFVLYYAEARKVYLYDPEANIIVEVATLAAGESISQ